VGSETTDEIFKDFTIEIICVKSIEIISMDFTQKLKLKLMLILMPLPINNKRAI
jgi:hypothetical protein